MTQEEQQIARNYVLLVPLTVPDPMFLSDCIRGIEIRVHQGLFLFRTEVRSRIRVTRSLKFRTVFKHPELFHKPLNILDCIIIILNNGIISLAIITGNDIALTMCVLINE